MKPLYLVLALASGCAVTEPPASTDPTPTPLSRLHVSLTDSTSIYTAMPPSLSTATPTPVALFLSISKVELQAADRTWTTVSSKPQTFDVLSYGDGSDHVLADADVAPGIYTNVRVSIDSASLVIGDTPTTLAVMVPFGDAEISNDLAGGTAYQMFLGFDAAASIAPATDTTYDMVPVLDVMAIVEK